MSQFKKSIAANYALNYIIALTKRVLLIIFYMKALDHSDSPAKCRSLF